MLNKFYGAISWMGRNRRIRKCSLTPPHHPLNHRNAEGLANNPKEFAFRGPDYEALWFQLILPDSCQGLESDFAPLSVTL